MLTFDPLKKVVNSLDEFEVMDTLSELKVVAPKLIKILNFHTEVYNVGKIVGVRYIKQREEIAAMRLELESLRTENEHLKANIK